MTSETLTLMMAAVSASGPIQDFVCGRTRINKPKTPEPLEDTLRRYVASLSPFIGTDVPTFPEREVSDGTARRWLEELRLSLPGQIFLLEKLLAEAVGDRNQEFVLQRTLGEAKLVELALRYL